MVVCQGFFSFFNCSSRFLFKLRSTKLYSKLNMVFNTCFVLRRSSIVHLAFRSAILSILSFEVVLCHSWQFPSCFMIHMLSRTRYFKSINLFIGVILCHISPKAFPKECCYCGAYQWSKFSLILPMVWVSRLLVHINAILLPVSGRLSPHNFEMFSISPLQAYSFRCWFPTTLL